MSTDRGSGAEEPRPLGLPDDAVLQLSRALVVMQSVRTAVHELNNVFQMISGSVELLQNNPALPAALRPRVDAVLRQSNRGEALVRGIGDLTRREPAGPRPVDLDAAIDRALEARRFEHRRAGLTVSRTATGSGPWTLRADPMDIQQVLLSLLMAAEAAAGGEVGASISLELTRTGPAIEVAIRHTGAARPDSSDPWGMTALAAGLGFSAARVVVSRLGGTLDDDVASAGHGVKLTLPADPL